MANIRGLEWIIILLIIVLLFGVGRLSKIGGELGKGIRSFRQGLKGDEEKDKAAATKSEEEPPESNPPA